MYKSLQKKAPQTRNTSIKLTLRIKAPGGLYLEIVFKLMQKTSKQSKKSTAGV